MKIVPFFKAGETELVPAEAGHMIAAVGTLDEHLAGGASLHLFKSQREIGVAGALVPGQLTLLAESNVACRTVPLALRRVDEALATVSGAQFEVRVADSLFPKQKSVIPLFALFRQALVHFSLQF
jgi:hypothetical protein